MAKTRSGLGRGLGSLLGEIPDEIIAPAPEKPVQEAQEGTASKKEEPLAGDNATQSGAEQKEIPAPDPQPQEELYSNKEDNITIKGVVERVVTPPVAPPAPTTLLSEPKAQEVADQDSDELVDLEVDINLVEPNPDQPRTNFKKEELEELANSIKKNGLLQPILVRRKGDHYQIIAGERRWQACKLLKLDKIPIHVKDVNDDETIILALVENIQRSDLNPIEEAYGYRRMMERGKMTQSEVAQAVSKGRSTIANSLRLLELPEEAQQLLFEEKITAGHARAILSIPTREGRRKLTDKLVEGDISVREAESLARLISGVKKESSKPRQQPPKSYKTVARTLTDTLNTTVKIKSSAGKNKIEIEFKDEADLERLFRFITNS